MSNQQMNLFRTRTLVRHKFSGVHILRYSRFTFFFFIRWINMPYFRMINQVYCYEFKIDRNALKKTVSDNSDIWEKVCHARNHCLNMVFRCGRSMFDLDKRGNSDHPAWSDKTRFTKTGVNTQPSLQGWKIEILRRWPVCRTATTTNFSTVIPLVILCD